MDTILMGLTVVAGCVGAGVALFLAAYYGLPAMVRQHGRDMAEQRDVFREILTDQRDTFRESLLAIVERNGQESDRICRALEALQVQVSEQSRQQAEQSRQLAALTAVIQRCDAAPRVKGVCDG